MTKEIKINFSMFSLLQYVFAVLVILLHAQQIFPNDGLHFVQKSIFSRMAVPFFIVSASFWLARKPEQLKITSKKWLCSYLGLSLLYLPYAVWYYQQSNYPGIYLPIGILASLFYTGTCYHLWYFPAILFGFFFYHSLRKLLPQKGLWACFLLLYLFGAIETYSAYLSGTFFVKLYDNYSQIFFTSRNGLFYVPIFILIGQSLYDNRQAPFLARQPFLKFVLAFGLLLAESFIIFQHQGYDKNFIFSLLPFTFFLVNWAWRTDLFREKQWQTLKYYSKYYYYFHPIFIELSFLWLANSDLKKWEKGIVVSLMTLVATHFLSHLLLKYAPLKRLMLHKMIQSIRFKLTNL
ncbi:acyltransferase family protein [Streptococcus rifensis]